MVIQIIKICHYYHLWTCCLTLLDVELSEIIFADLGRWIEN